MVDNPCFECGQCCQHFRVSFYHGEIAGTGAGVVPTELTTQITPHLSCMKGTEKGRAPCVALRHSNEEGYRCSIYENRPSPCREFNILNDDGTVNQDCQKLQQIAKQKKQQGLGGLPNQQFKTASLLEPCVGIQKHCLGVASIAYSQLALD